MRLVKTVAYALLGYVLYELFLGLAEGKAPGRRPSMSGGQKGRTAGASAPTGRPGGSRIEGRGRSANGGQTFGGTEAGGREVTRDGSGAMSRHSVGRGVTE
jgi:hypothetical protein